MTEFDRELLQETNKLLKYFTKDVEKFHSVASKIMPEIERTRTIERMERDRAMFFYKSKKSA